MRIGALKRTIPWAGCRSEQAGQGTGSPTSDNRCGVFNAGNNRARDQQQILAERDRDHWLHVEDILGSLTQRSVAEIGVVLKKQTDQVGDRILCCFGEC